MSPESVIASLADLEARLAAGGPDYLVLGPLPAAAVEVCFAGPFQGQRVLWRMRLATLAAFEEEEGFLPRPPERPRGAMRIAAQEQGVWRASVGLAVGQIDEPTVRKAIVMMRNYRALRPGLRVWGD
jgi:hypothetical protein